MSHVVNMSRSMLRNFQDQTSGVVMSRLSRHLGTPGNLSAITNHSSFISREQAISCNSRENADAAGELLHRT